MIMKIRVRIFLLCLALFISLLPGYASVAAQQTSSQQAATQQMSASRQTAAANAFSFAVLSDPHGITDSWVNALTEARDGKADADHRFGMPEFVLVTGDMTPIDATYADFAKIFNGSATAKAPVYLPAIGNHEADDKGGFPGGMGGTGPGGGQGGMSDGMGMSQGPGGPSGQGGQSEIGRSQGEGGQPSGGMGPGGGRGGVSATGDASVIDLDYISDKIIAAIPGAVRMSEKSYSYYYDYKNVRVISLDGYSGEAGTGGVINEKGRAWTEKAITSAPATIDHIFIGFHAPAFPRGRHLQDSFNANAGERNAFWDMLISHKDRVKAVFSGHTHVYARLRVLNPSGAAANDFNTYPDEAGGIYQVVAGSTGNGTKNTFLRVEIEGKNIYFRTYEAANGKDQPFAVKEEWSIIDDK